MLPMWEALRAASFHLGIRSKGKAFRGCIVAETVFEDGILLDLDSRECESARHHCAGDGDGEDYGTHDEDHCLAHD